MKKFLSVLLSVVMLMQVLMTCVVSAETTDDIQLSWGVNRVAAPSFTVDESISNYVITLYKDSKEIATVKKLLLNGDYEVVGGSYSDSYLADMMAQNGSGQYTFTVKTLNSNKEVSNTYTSEVFNYTAPAKSNVDTDMYDFYIDFYNNLIDISYDYGTDTPYVNYYLRYDDEYFLVYSDNVFCANTYVGSYFIERVSSECGENIYKKMDELFLEDAEKYNKENARLAVRVALIPEDIVSNPVLETEDLSDYQIPELYTVDSGIWDNVTWTLYSNGVLEFEGTGEMPEYQYGEYGFLSRHKFDIKKVVIGEGITTIRYGAFEDCGYLLEAVLPSTLTKIGSSAFKGTHLTQIDFPASLEMIEGEAFANCYLEKVEIPDSVTTFYGGFEGNQNLKMVSIGDGVTCAQGFQSCIALEKVIFGKNVNEIGYNAFDFCISLESIEIPDKVTSIGGAAFRDCVKLKNVTMPSKLITIEESAFCRCKVLEEITIPNSVSTIGRYSFDGCIALKEIVFPVRVSEIQENALRDCSALEKIYIYNSECDIDSYMHYAYNYTPTIYGYENSTAQTYASSRQYPFEILEGTPVGDESSAAFTINGGATSTEDPQLTLNVEVNEYTKYKIEDGEYINLTSNKQDILYTLPYLNHGKYFVNVTFANEDETKVITVTQSINFIHKHKVKYMLDGVVKKEVEVGVGQSVPATDYIPVKAGYRFVKWIDVPEIMPDGDVEVNAEMVEQDVVAYGECGDNVTWVLRDNKVLTISGTGAIKDYVQSWEYAPWYAQAHYGNIDSVVIGEGITEIGTRAFEDISFKTISLPSTLKTIGYKAFDGAADLESIVLPDGLTTIKDVAFAGCVKIPEIKIPLSVTEIGSNAFLDCENLAKIYIYNKDCDIYDYLGTIPENTKMYVLPESTALAFAEKYEREYEILSPSDIPNMPYANFTINGGETSTENKEITLNLTANIYTKYKIADGDYNTIPESNTVAYTLGSKDGNYDITITFATDDLSKTTTITKSITFNNIKKVTYKVNQEVFREVNQKVGHPITVINETPEIFGYNFVKWSTIPDVMPDNDIIVNAELERNNRTKIIGKVFYKDGEPPQTIPVFAFISLDNTKTLEDGTFEVEYDCGSYNIKFTTRDGRTKTVFVNATDVITDLGNIVITPVGTEVEVVPEQIESIEGIEEILNYDNLSQEEKDYIAVPGNNISVKVDVNTTSVNENISSTIASQYSSYQTGILLDIDISKVKSGAETATTPILETSSLLSVKIEIPGEIAGKDEYIVLREHNGVVDALRTTANADGEYIEVSNGFITIHAKKFSTYALIGKDIVSYVSSGGGISKYTVKFETNGGNTIKSQTVSRNTVVKAPENPVKDGFEFDGWYSDKELTTKFDFATKITKSITLYAKWSELPKTEIILVIGQKDATVNGEIISNDVEPVIVNDRTMLPIRFIAEKLGAKVGWEQETQTVSVELGDINISLVIGENFATVNGERIELDSPSFIKNDRTFLPIRFVMENLGATVEWDEINQRVTITK